MKEGGRKERKRGIQGGGTEEGRKEEKGRKEWRKEGGREERKMGMQGRGTEKEGRNEAKEGGGKEEEGKLTNRGERKKHSE